MSLLSVRDIRKSYGSRTILDGVAFTVGEGEKIGLIGANGSGKSTLLRVVAGVEGMDEGGELALRRGARIGHLAQEPSFEPGITIHEAAAAGQPELQRTLAAYREVTRGLAAVSDADSAGPSATLEMETLLTEQAELTTRLDQLDGWDWEHRVEAMLTRVGIDGWDRPVERLSGGERKRVALARTLLAQPELLLLDEPTNHLDADTVLWLEEHLVDYPGAVLLITHDRYFLDRVVDRMLEIAHGTLTGYDGGYTEYLEAQEERLELEAVEEAKRRKLVAQELEWARRSPPARTGKQKARRRRTAELEEEQRRYRETTGRRREVRIEAAAAPRLGRTVLEIDDVDKAYGENVLLRGFSASLRAGQRIGIIGPNGSGKTTLLRIILGEERADAGSVELGVNTRIAYFDQRRAQLDEEKSVYENAAGTDWVTVGDRRVHLRSYLEEFLFPTSVQQQKVRSLSGGERNRLMLAKLFLQESNLLILDEPTNDLDLVTLQVLESVLAEYPGCVLVVTHDRFFLDKVATDLFVFEGRGERGGGAGNGRGGGGQVAVHTGGYDLYLRRKEAREAEAAAEAAEQRERERVREKRRAEQEAKRAAAQPRSRKLTWKEARELEGLEGAILAAEEELDALETRLADPAIYTDGTADIGELTSAFDAARAKVDALYDRWAELEEKAGG